VQATLVLSGKSGFDDLKEKGCLPKREVPPSLRVGVASNRCKTVAKVYFGGALSLLGAGKKQLVFFLSLGAADLRQPVRYARRLFVFFWEVKR
jgi:hypothetical protein